MSPEPGAPAAPIIVSALFAPADQAWLDNLRWRHFPPERNQLAAHLSLFHHLPPTAAAELKQRLAATTNRPPVACMTAGLMDLGRGTAIRMLAPELADIRNALADAFRGLLVPQDQAGWRPHVTIQNKVAPIEAKALQASLTDLFDTPRHLKITALAAWWYRGGPWEPLSRHPLRG